MIEADDEVTEPCPACGEDIYDDAERCPHCGHYVTLEESPGDAWPLWMKLAAGLALIAIGLWLVSWASAAFR